MKKSIKITFTFCFLIISPVIFSQQNVGIMTGQPLEKVHIGGTSSVIDSSIGDTDIALISPTIRIDGLNMANNPAIFSAPDTTSPLYVNSNGDTFVAKAIEIFGTYTLPGEDAITSSTTVNITADYAYQTTGDLLTTSFTLKQKSVVYISSTLTADIQNSSGGAISDGTARGIAAFIWFTNAPASSGISTTSSYMSDGFSFASRNSSSINRGFKLSPSSELVLPEGNYTIVLRGGGITSPNDNFRIIWGGGDGDKLNIIAKPL
ncbi:hypothetical protein M2347_001157 [Chryseobacterium sp. H1D6B]|uniref:hypothetical protein n=1 Tax=Chryseobacterium sp. H1D6B TaxID=2940588 RepID=UPI0015CD3496|nr:hypothetical protein [Chryseobacterium sp. H1D6B]MDH6251430.1 hypothetical protein [Chryseobacterium sp. H1D6B]